MDKEENAIVNEKNEKIIEPACVTLPTEQQLTEQQLYEIRECLILWLKSLLDEKEEHIWVNPLLKEIAERNVKWAKEWSEEFKAKVLSGEITFRGTDFDGDE